MPSKTIYTPIVGSTGSAAEKSPSTNGSDSNDAILGAESQYRRASWVTWWKTPAFVISHSIVLVLYIAGVVLVAHNGRRCIKLEEVLPFSPARSVVEWGEHNFSLEDRIQEKGSFSGRPRPDLDQAWHDLLNAENIVIEPEYMQRLGRENIGVMAPEGNGYLGTLNVYHEIHCLKRIKQFMYSDYYFPGISDHERELNRLHNEHCIDFLRQSAMCHGDIGLITFEWHENSRIPVANATTHHCVNWQKLDSWTKQRSVDMMKPGWLIHPTKGAAYPEGKGDKIGAAEGPHMHGSHTVPPS